jgi:two-component system response regulator HydG
MNSPLLGNILCLDDDEDACELLATALEARGFTVRTETDAETAISAAMEDDFDAVLTDLQLGDTDGLSVCTRILAGRPSLPIVVVTGHASLDTAVAAMRAGAFDFLTKPLDLDLLALTVARAVQHYRLKLEVHRLRNEIAGAQGFERLLGKSLAMRRVFDVVTRVAQTSASVLVGGESGTGKELVARAIHERSPRSDGPFVAINCAAVPATLLESELFGHARGAFTDAKMARKGLFLEANGGTLFLDEIGEMPLDMQVKLLRALQERRVRPVGGDKEVAFDARVVTATNRDLEADVHAKRFREDLYYRINVVSVDVPPLRDREGDIPVLAAAFVARFAARHGKHVEGLAPAALEKLINYQWPGNVRELENCMERAVAMTQTERVIAADLPERVRAYRPEQVSALLPQSVEELVTVDELETRYLRHVLGLVKGNKSRAARILGYDRRTLYRKLERLEGTHATPAAESKEPLSTER